MSTSDWDLGQKLIEQGACSLDQVREILSLQDRMRRMGAVSKPFARVLLERGYARRDQLLQAGVPEGDLPPPVDEKTAPPKVATVPAAPSAKPLVWVAVGLAVLGVLIIFGRGTFSEPEGVTVSVELTPEEIDAVSQSELDRIIAFVASGSNFDNAPDVVNSFESFKQARAGTRWEVEAHRRLKDYRELIEGHARPELEDLLKGEPPLLEQQRWSELLAHYRKFPAKFLETTDSGRAVKQKIQEVTQRLTEQFVKDRSEAEKLTESKKFAEALALVKAMEVRTPPERQAELQGMRGRIEIAGRGAAERSRQDVADAYFKVDGAFKQAMLRRDGFRAALVIREFITAPWKEDQRPFVKVRGVDYEALFKAFEPWDPERIASICESAIPEVDSPDRLGTGEGALLALRNAAFMAIFIRDERAQFHAATSSKQSLDLPGLGKGHFDKKEGKTVFLTEAGDVLDPEAHPLTEPDLAALAMMVGPPNAAMHARVGFFYFYAATTPKLLEAAYEHLARATTMGARGVKLFLGGLAVVAEGELRRELETKFGAARDLYKTRQWPQVKKMLGDLLEFPDHPFTQSVRPEIEKMLYDIAEGTDKQKQLAVQYKTRVEIVDDATLRVVYDFEGKEQQDAFETVVEEGARKFKGRWRVDRGTMESSVDASVMRWKPAVKGDVTLEYDLTPMEEAQNIVLDLYYKKGRATHYAVVLGFDWVGKQDGDRDNSAEDRFGMPRACVIKYPVSVDKSLWKDPEPWDVWKSRLVGKAAGPWRPVKGKPSRLRVERQGSSLRVLADRVLIFEGDDSEYGEGQLLFYSDSRCRIDNLVITFKP